LYTARSDSGASYTTETGVILRKQTEVDGEIGFWPYSSKVSYTLGDHPRAQRLKSINLRDRALIRFTVDTEFVIHKGNRVGTV
jgi:hypothetical protein